MNTKVASFHLPWTKGDGIHGLILFLRQRGFNIGASEAIDAAKLVAHLARTDPEVKGRVDMAWLVPKLRPVLCKRSEDQDRFESLFHEWSRLRIVAKPDAGSNAASPVVSKENSGSHQIAARARSRRWLVVVVCVLIASVSLYSLLRRPDPKDPVAAPDPPPALPVPIDQTPTPQIPTPNQGASEEERFYGYFPAVRYNWELRPWVAGSLLGLGALAVLGLAIPLALPLLGHSRLSGRRVPLDLASLREEAKRIVPPLQADTQARLERHVSGPANQRERLLRRPPLHVGRTLEATVRNLGVMSLRYRDARLRPSYLLIVEVSGASDGSHKEIVNDPRGRMFYRWAERLRRQGIDVAIRLARVDPESGSAVTCRPTGTDWQLDGVDGESLERLPTPPLGQRLVVVSDGNLFTDAEGRWRAWTRGARLHRWSQRAIFTPTEPRHWGVREDALERRERLADPGFFVLPLDESALAAWAELVVSGRLPRFTLSRAQRYPMRLRELEDAGQIDKVLDPDRPVDNLAELLDQLKFYLGENGYFWLAACAVPPIVRWELTLLLGEQYYLGAKVKPEELPDYIARDYPRLALLPWLRRQFMPDWLRLALLDSLSLKVQEEVRQVVRSKLGQIRLDAAGEDALSLEEPPGPLVSGYRQTAERNHSDTLYLGYVAGHSPRQLMLRAPREWRNWLAQLPGRQRAGLWVDWLAALRDRLLWRRGLSFFGASRQVLAWGTLSLAALAALAFGLTATPPTSLPVDVRELFFTEQGRAVTYPHAGPVYAAAFSPDGRRVVTASFDNSAQLWDAQSGQALGASMRHRDRVVHAAFSPDGRRVLTGSLDHTARLWDAQSGHPLGAPMGHEDWVIHAAFSPDGRRVVTASFDRTARLWDAQSGQALGEPMRHERAVNYAAFSFDGRRVVTASYDGTARLWDAQSGQALGTPMLHTQVVHRAAFSPDGRRVVTASWDNNARLWDSQSGLALGVPMRHEDRIFYADFSPDGVRVVTTSADNTARLWDAQSGRALGEPMRHEGSVFNAAFSPDGRRVMTASRDNTARLWDVQSGQALGEPMRHKDRVVHAAFSPDGRRVVTSSDDNTARLWNAQNDLAVGEPMRHERSVHYAAFSPDGQRVLTASWDNTAQLWDAESGQALGVPLRHGGPVIHAAFSPDGQRVVTGSGDMTARLWDAHTGKALSEPLRHEGPLYHAAFSPDGRQVVTASWDNTARLWDAHSGRPLAEPLRHEDRVLYAAFSPDGRQVVTASRDKTARLWDAQSGLALGEPLRHEDQVNYAAFTPDGRRMVTASSDNTARLWDAHSGQAIGEPLRHDDIVTRAAFSPDGLAVVTASWDNTARLWDAQSGKAMSEPMRHEQGLTHAAFSPDGLRVVTASDDKSARLWDAQSGALLGAPMWHGGRVWHAAFSPDGRRVVTASEGLAKPPSVSSFPPKPTGVATWQKVGGSARLSSASPAQALSGSFSNNGGLLIRALGALVSDAHAGRLPLAQRDFNPEYGVTYLLAEVTTPSQEPQVSNAQDSKSIKPQGRTPKPKLTESSRVQVSKQPKTTSASKQPSIAPILEAPESQTVPATVPVAPEGASVDGAPTLPWEAGPGSAQVWRVPPHPLPVSALVSVAPTSSARLLAVGLGVTCLFSAAALTGWFLRRRSFYRLVDAMAV